MKVSRGELLKGRMQRRLKPRVCVCEAREEQASVAREKIYQSTFPLPPVQSFVLYYVFGVITN